MRDQNFNSADEQGNKAQGGDPVSDADKGRVPRSKSRGWDGRGRTWNTSGIAHTGMVSAGAHIVQAGRNRDFASRGYLAGDPEVEADREWEVLVLYRKRSGRQMIRARGMPGAGELLMQRLEGGRFGIAVLRVLNSVRMRKAE